MAVGRSRNVAKVVPAVLEAVPIILLGLFNPVERQNSQAIIFSTPFVLYNFDNRSSRFFICDIVPSLKPISTIFSNRSRDSL